MAFFIKESADARACVHHGRADLHGAGDGVVAALPSSVGLPSEPIQMAPIAGHRQRHIAAGVSRDPRWGLYGRTRSAVGGALKLVPEGRSLTVLEQDYQHMVDDGVLLDVPDTFDELMRRRAKIETRE